jgi:hypothetical protein
MSEEMSSDHFDRLLVADDITANLQLLNQSVEREESGTGEEKR